MTDRYPLFHSYPANNLLRTPFFADQCLDLMPDLLPNTGLSLAVTAPQRQIRIAAFAGTRMADFKKHDKKTHNAAQTLAQSAADKDGYAIISDFANLQNSCLMCHQDFRQSFQKHFYGKH